MKLKGGTFIIKERSLQSSYNLSLTFRRCLVLDGDFSNIRFMQMDWHGPPLEPHVKHLYKHREAHRKVDVTFRYVPVHALNNQRKSDQKQKRERQHFYRRVAIHKAAYSLGREDHYTGGD